MDLIIFAIIIKTINISGKLKNSEKLIYKVDEAEHNTERDEKEKH